MSPRQPSLSVVVPVYNGAESLTELVERIIATLEPIAGVFEIVLVDDGSRDSSWQVIEGLVAEHDCVHGIALGRNCGQHNALLAGIRAARFDLIATIDDDLQHPPEELPRLLAELEQGYDVVYGAQARPVHGVMRAGASKLTKLALSQFMTAEMARRVSAYRLFRTSIRDAFEHYESPMANIDVLLTWGTSRFSYVEVEHDRRKHGESNYGVGRLITHAVNMITGYSVRPLQVASLLGFAFMFVGLAVLAVVLVNYGIRGGRVPGFTFIASTVALFAGIQLFALGIIGEYLARTHMRVMGRPSYVVRRTIGPRGSKPDDGSV